jgi:hypothetical protein
MKLFHRIIGPARHVIIHVRCGGVASGAHGELPAVVNRLDTGLVVHRVKPNVEGTVQLQHRVGEDAGAAAVVQLVEVGSDLGNVFYMHISFRLQQRVGGHDHIHNLELRDSLARAVVHREDQALDAGVVEAGAAAGVVGLDAEGESDLPRLHRLPRHVYDAAGDRERELLGPGDHSDGVGDDQDDEHRHGGGYGQARRVEPPPERRFPADGVGCRHGRASASFLA